MTKTHIMETTEKYDKDGKLVEKIVREETKEDKGDCFITSTCNPNIVTIPYVYNSCVGIQTTGVGKSTVCSSDPNTAWHSYNKAVTT